MAKHKKSHTVDAAERLPAESDTANAVARFLFLYLDTGGGHLAPARVIQRDMEERYPGEAAVDLLNGFGPRQVFARLFFEKGYYAACNYLPGAFSLMYDMAERPLVLHTVKKFITWRTAKYLEKYMASRGITNVVSFHFALVPAAVRAARRLLADGRIERPIPVIVVVTDPYTGPKAWFLEKDVFYIVFSQDIKREAVEKNGIPADHVLVQPFILDRKFAPLNDAGAVSGLKTKRGFNPLRPVVLIAGGGDGLPGVVPLVREFIAHKPEFSIAVVCGHNEQSRKQLAADAEWYPDLCVHVYGFVPFMDDLIRLADCVITKAGASTVMEVLACRKPVIFSTYIHGQEQGNVEFVTSHGAGWFIRSPEGVYRRICELLSSPLLREKTVQRLDALNIRADTRETVDFIRTYAGPVRAPGVDASHIPEADTASNSPNVPGVSPDAAIDSPGAAVHSSSVPSSRFPPPKSRKKSRVSEDVRY